MTFKYSSAQEYVERVFSLDVAAKKLAQYLHVNNAHIYRARQGDITPTLVRAIAAKGFIPPPPPKTRCRIAADVSPAQRDRLHAIAAAEGLTWSEYCRRLADERE